MRRRSKIDPAVAGDLEALDAVLAGERHDPELALIAGEARASAPQMSPEFATRLDAAAAAGFAGGRGAAGAPGVGDETHPLRGFDRPRARGGRRLVPALGAGFAALAALVVAVSALNGGGGDPAVTAPAGHEVASGSTAEAPAAAVADAIAPTAKARATKAAPRAPSRATLRESAALDSQRNAQQAAPGAEGQAVQLSDGTFVVPEPVRVQDTATVVPPPGAGPRRVQRAADLTISTPVGKLQDTSDAVTATIDRVGGFVYRSDVSASGDTGTATFDLRIPTSRLAETLAALSRLGHVRSRTEQSQDITARFSSSLSRLHDARAERQALLRALAKATSPLEIESLRARLHIARSRIAAAKGDLLAARRASNLSRVGVTVLGVADGQSAPTGRPWTPARALDDAVHVLSVAAGVAIVALAAGIPAALLALLLGLAWRANRRHRRELALDVRPA